MERPAKHRSGIWKQHCMQLSPSRHPSFISSQNRKTHIPLPWESVRLDIVSIRLSHDEEITTGQYAPSRAVEFHSLCWMQEQELFHTTSCHLCWFIQLNVISGKSVKLHWKYFVSHYAPFWAKGSRSLYRFQCRGYSIKMLCAGSARLLSTARIRPGHPVVTVKAVKETVEACIKVTSPTQPCKFR